MRIAVVAGGLRGLASRRRSYTGPMAPRLRGQGLVGLALAWLGGAALQLHERELMQGAVYAALAAAGFVCLATGWACRRRARLVLLCLLGVALAGFAWTGGRALPRVAQTLGASLEGQDIVVDGVIASLPQHGPAGTRFRLRVESAVRGGHAVVLPDLLALGWYRGAHEDAASAQPRTELRAGQRWRLTLRLRQPHGNVNPHGFDYELYLFELGVGATGYVRDAPATLLHAAAAYPVQRLRQAVRDAIDASVAERRIAGLLSALAIGDQAAIEREDWDLFRNTGVAHLMSISGLHVTMFAWLAGLLLGVLWRHIPGALLRVPLPHAVRWSGLAAAIGYALLSGWGVPAQRTVWMLATVTLLQSIGVAWPWPLVLLAAAAVVSLIDPWALLQPGFWLSFGAVALLMASRPAPVRAAPGPHLSWLRGAMQRLAAVLRGGIRTQVIATLGLTPLTLVFFQQVSLVGLVANLFAIPLVTLLITPLALLGVLAAPLWLCAASVSHGLIGALAWLAALPGAVWTLPAAPTWAQAAGLLGAGVLILPLPWRARLLGVTLTIPLLLPVPRHVETGRFELLALDVGQGTAVLVRTRHHLLLYDAGPQYSRDSDAGQRVLLPLLRGRGETRIDKLVLSHRDSDHVGGARAVLAALPAGELLSSLEATHPLRATGPTHTRCEAGQSWQWDGVQFDVLGPPPERYPNPPAAEGERSAARPRPNALSCVLRIASAQGRVLLTGDIEREQESALVAQHGAALRSDVLVVPHHGSKTSSSTAFLDAVAPRLAVIQAGYRNRFGHPAPDVVARYAERGIQVIHSPACGAWAWPVESGAGGQCLRDTTRRYWRHAPAQPITP
jgi:competence protein ComEC